ncbi:ribonuclease domain-containing protein [Spirillospora sp. CA-294931]|uniref:ribonuclease domain-containing protein n=1 Tax=Spirillospora sp. CA-294931 TaxID=3240042 RepID=UPI003D9085F0
MSTPRSLKVRRAAIAAPLLALGLLAPAAQAVAAPVPSTAITTVGSADIPPICKSKLPKEADDTVRLIDSNGPFPYPQDGTVFQNREGLLPKEPQGFYHEYTVKTPNISHRGARRIVTSGDEGHEGMYYTSDHYRSFSDIDWSC